MTGRDTVRTGPTTLPAVLALALGTLAACSPPGTSPQGGQETSATDQVYTARGEVKSVPDGSGGAGNHLRIHHEALPDFVGYDGEVVGMASMTMPFPAADDVEIGDLEVGDKIEFTFEMDWDGSPAYQIVEIRRLPPDTELDFGQEESEQPGEEHSVPENPPPPP